MGNKEVFSEFVQAFQNGDLDRMSEYFAEDCRFHEPEVLPWGGDFVGKAGFRELIEIVSSKYSIEILKSELIEGGDDFMIYSMSLRWTSLRTSESFDMPVIELHRVKDGKILDADIYYKDPTRVTNAA